MSANVRWIALTIGVALFVATLYSVNIPEAGRMVRRLGWALPLALLFSALWHLARTYAWILCFPRPRTVGFARLARVRLAAEAFSYLTLRGIAGEPLKVVLLSGSVDARQATAAVALEHLAFMVGTTVIVGIGSLLAMATLPLTHGWFRVFRAFAIIAGVISVLSAAAIAGQGTYLQSAMRWIDRRLGSSIADNRFGRFVAAVERLMLQLVRDHPKRLVVLCLTTLAAFACMVMEAWVILRAVDPTLSLTGAFAVETFSRVASFASAIIPANIGALEAASVAAAAAVATSGGAALAVARRIRGLFWAGLGLLLYPRQPVMNRPDTAGPMVETGKPSDTLLYVPAASDVPVPPWSRLAGLPIAERVVRAAFRAGYSRIIVLRPDAALQSDVPGREKSGISKSDPNITIVSSEREWRDAVASLRSPGALTVIGPGTVVSPALLESALSLSPAGDEVADVAAGPDWRESGVLRVGSLIAMDLGRLESQLAWRRARALPLPSGEDVALGRARLAVRILSKEQLAAAEQTIRRSSYKDTDATLARFNRRMSLPLSVSLIRTPLTANQLSVMLVALGFYSAWLFSLGYYWTGVLGAFLSLAASVLDGCDGEIARLKYQESALGCWIETIGDYSYYVAIFVGLSVGAARHTGLHAFYWVGALALAGTLISFALLIHLRRRITAGRPERLHTIARVRFKAEPTWWSRVLWRISFVATRSAMPYGIMALALVNALPLVVALAAVGANTYWISLIVKFRNLVDDSADASMDRGATPA